MKLTLIIEATQDPTFIPRLIPLLTEMPLAEILAQPFVAELLPPLLERHREAIELIRNRAEDATHDLFDITDHLLEGFNKFIPYYLYPNAIYSIGLSRSASAPSGCRLQPWTKADPAKMVNLARSASATAAADTPRRRHQLPARPWGRARKARPRLWQS